MQFKTLTGLVLIVVIAVGASGWVIATAVKPHPVLEFGRIQSSGATVFPLGDPSKVRPDFPSLHGRLRAIQDLGRGEPKFYLYGLIDAVSAMEISDAVSPFGLTPEFAGCLIGTPKYDADMAYNETIEQARRLSVSEILRSRPVEGRVQRGVMIVKSDE